MKLTKCKKIILTVIMLASVVLLFSSNTAFAAINTDYSQNDPVSNAGLDDAISDSVLLQLLAKLVYGIGRFIEWITGIIFTLLTNSSDFPWADKIVFNSVPLLDVNFINPDPGSFVGQDQMKAVIRNLYSTVLALAISFFGIVVLITAIKLVISTIASDKAKYKQAIVDWLVGFVMLFCIHYGISFIFYLNEQLVVVASKIVTSQLESVRANAMIEASVQVDQLIESVKDIPFAGKYKGRDSVPIKTILSENKMILERFITLDTSDDSNGLHELLTTEEYKLGYDLSILPDSQMQNMAAIITWAATSSQTVEDVRSWAKNDIYFAYASGVWTDDEKGIIVPIQVLKNFDYIEYRPHLAEGDYENFIISRAIEEGGAEIYTKDDFGESDGIMNTAQGDMNKWNNYSDDTEFLMSGYVWNQTSSSGDELHTTFDWVEVFNDLIELKIAAASTSDSGSLSYTNRLIPDLAAYFKYYAQEKEISDSGNVVGLTNSGNINIQNMLMYAILVIQSLILFIAYIKRLFYVVILALMAPIVVVLDFFQKFGK